MVYVMSVSSTPIKDTAQPIYEIMLSAWDCGLLSAWDWGPSAENNTAKFVM